jgi:hypothetical protein
MSSLDNFKEVTKYAQNQTVQIIFGSLLIAVMSFLGGRSSINIPPKSVVCSDIIKDNENLSLQLSEERISCEESKTSALKEFQHILDIQCAERVEKALEGCEFSEDLHCPICVARGVCK